MVKYMQKNYKSKVVTYVSHCNHQNVSLPVRFQADYCLECLYMLIFRHSLKYYPWTLLLQYSKMGQHL